MISTIFWIGFVDEILTFFFFFFFFNKKNQNFPYFDQ